MSLVKFGSDVPDPQFRVRPDPDPDFFFKSGSGRTRIVLSNLESGRNRIRIFFSNYDPAGTGPGHFFQIKIRPDPDIRQKWQYPAESGPG